MDSGGQCTVMAATELPIPPPHPTISCRYDSDDNLIPPADKKKIEPLPKFDHSKYNYPKFNKNFHVESPEAILLSDADVARQAGEMSKKTALNYFYYLFARLYAHTFLIG
jgi:hypothetical protein